VRSAVLQDMLSVRPSVCYVWISKKLGILAEVINFLRSRARKGACTNGNLWSKIWLERSNKFSAV